MNATLFSWGPVLFQVAPLNVHEYDHITNTEFARKLIMGRGVSREFVGEGDEEIVFNGMIFPKRIGGVANLAQLDAIRFAGLAQPLIRGSSPGEMLGWFGCQHLERRHSSLSVDGMGKVIAWQGFFARMDQPSASSYVWNLTKALA